MFLALSGGLAARVRGANVVSGIIDLTFWWTVAMAVTAGTDRLFVTTV